MKEGGRGGTAEARGVCGECWRGHPPKRGGGGGGAIDAGEGSWCRVCFLWIFLSFFLCFLFFWGVLGIGSWGVVSFFLCFLGIWVLRVGVYASEIEERVEERGRFGVQDSMAANISGRYDFGDRRFDLQRRLLHICSGT